jgi:hypothetical protein
MTTRQRIVITGLLLFAGVLMVLGFQWSKDRDDVVVARDPLVVAVSPAPGDQMLRQDTIFAEILLPQDGTLRVDGIEIPPQFLQKIQTGNATRLSYTPGDNTPTGVLGPGNHRAVVQYWHPDQGRAASREYIWSFTVV